MGRYLTISVILMLCELGIALPAEPMCSPFDYQLKTLETMLRTEQSVKQLMEEIKADQESAKEEFKKFELEIKKEFEDLKAKNNKQLSDQKEKMELLTRQSVENTLEQMKKRINGMTVAFSVDNPTKATVNGVPTFQTTVTNTGGGYNMDTGVFTSPVDGLYMFVFVVAAKGSQVECNILHNGSSKAFGRTYIDTSYTTVSTSVYLMLTKGDTVSLGDCRGWRQVNAGGGTTFNGALIKQTGLN